METLGISATGDNTRRQWEGVALYPGSVEGVAVIVTCTPGFTFCTAKAQLQNKIPIHGGGEWGDIGKPGPTEDGCGDGHASVAVVGCSEYPELVSYRTVGEYYTVFEGHPQPDVIYSSVISGNRLCD